MQILINIKKTHLIVLTVFIAIFCIAIFTAAQPKVFHFLSEIVRDDMVQIDSDNDGAVDDANQARGLNCSSGSCEAKEGDLQVSDGNIVANHDICFGTDCKSDWADVGGSVGGCPAGYADAGSYCIEIDERTPENWNNAVDICSQNGARLCSLAEHAGACSTVAGLNNMIDDNEYVDDIGVVMVIGEANIVTGLGGCGSFDTIDGATSVPFRCCMSKGGSSSSSSGHFGWAVPYSCPGVGGVCYTQIIEPVQCAGTNVNGDCNLVDCPAGYTMVRTQGDSWDDYRYICIISGGSGGEATQGTWCGLCTYNGLESSCGGEDVCSGNCPTGYTFSGWMTMHTLTETIATCFKD